MRKRIILSIIAWCCHFTLSYAGTAMPLDDSREKVIQEGVAALNKLIRENRRHTQEGESFKNRYVLVLEGNGKFIEQKNVQAGKLVYTPILSESEEKSINEALQLINAKKDFGVYVLVFNSWVIDLKKEIPADANLKNVMALKPYTNEDIKTKVWAETNQLGEDILLRSEMSSFAARIGVVYGREICYLGKNIHRVYATSKAFATGLGEGELNGINNSLKGKLPPLSETHSYLMTFPLELYNAYLRNKGVKTSIKLDYEFTPNANSYFDKMQSRLGGPKCGDCPAPNDPSSLVFDYSSILTPEEKAKMFTKLGFISTESRKYKTKLYITDYQCAPAVIDAVQEYAANPDSKDIILWVHFDQQKKMEMKTAYGKDVPNKEYTNSFMKFLIKILPDSGLDFDPFTAILDGLATMINALEIPERFYNPEHINLKTGEADYNPLFYRTFQISSTITLNPAILGEFMKTGAKFTPLQVEFAAVCGFWNGLVTTVSGLPTFFSWGIKMIVNENNTRDDFVKGITKMYYQCAQKHIQVLIPGQQDIGFALCAWDGISKHFTEGNACVIAAKVGGAIFQVITLVAAVTKLGNLARISELVNIVDPINLLFKGLGVVVKSVVLPTGELAYACGKGFVTAVMQNGKYVIRLVDGSFRAISEIDWSKVISWAEMTTEYGIRVRVGLLMSAEEFRNAGYKIKKMVTDATGGEFVDANGNKFAVVGKEGDEASNTVAIVEEAAQDASRIASEITQETVEHIMYGKIKVKVTDRAGNLVKEYEYIPGQGGQAWDPKQYIVTVDVGGCHTEDMIKAGLVEIVPGTKVPVGTLPTGEVISKAKIRFKVKELEAGGTGFKAKKDLTTFWPDTWDQQKIMEKITEAFNNKTNVQYNQWIGTTADGVKIQMFLDANGNITTAFITF